MREKESEREEIASDAFSCFDTPISQGKKDTRGTNTEGEEGPSWFDRATQTVSK